MMDKYNLLLQSKKSNMEVACSKIEDSNFKFPKSRFDELNVSHLDF